MNIGILSDLHFGANKDDNDLLEFQLKSLKYFIEQLKDRGVTTIVISGDVFHSKKEVNNKTYNTVKSEFFDLLKRYGFKVELIPGNHDYYYTNSSDVKSISNLEEFDNIRIFDKPMIMPEYNNIGFVPYLANVDEKSKFLEFIKTKCNETKVIIGHFDIAGFAMTKQYVSDSGFDTNVFKDFQSVISGHFHIRQSSGNINYVGSPYQITWNDVGDVRGVHILDTKTGIMEFIPNPEEMYKRIELTDTTDLKKVSETLLNFNNKHVKIVSDNVEISNKLLKKLKDTTLDLKTFDLYEKDIDDEVIDDDDAPDTSDLLELATYYVEKHYVVKTKRNNAVIINKLLNKAYNKVI